MDIMRLEILSGHYLELYYSKLNNVRYENDILLIVKGKCQNLDCCDI